ncbi:MAG TPA: phosphodiesterase, partial [Proteiniclasticum sp.]|nr:phosphodiesterase [Proteiniclasticum sp.]
DETGYLLYSNLDNLIGWEIYPDHPIDLFLKSDEMSLVEDIRQDVITGDWYKYGYFRLENGGLLQVGIRANTVYAFLERFSVNNILTELKNNESALHIDLLDQNLSIIESTDSYLSEPLPSIKDAREALDKNREYSFVNDSSEDQYFRVIVPIHLEDNLTEEDMYALSISYSLEGTMRQIRNVSFFGLTALLLIYGFLFYIMVSTYRKNESLKRAAYFNELTGLPNKLYLEKYLVSDMDKGRQKKSALMLLRISNLNSINMNYGYHFGDQVLKTIPEKLDQFDARGGKFFSFTADQFILYKEDFSSMDELTALSDDLSDSFRNPLTVEGTDMYLSIKIGIVVVDEFYKDFNSVLKDASVALEQTFKDEKDAILFDEKMYQSIQREDILVKEMRRVIKEKDQDVIYLEYQPIVDTITRKIVGFEALARMNSSLFGRVSPVEFIEAAEKNLIMVELGSYLMDLAFDFIKELEEKGFSEIRVAVNVSGIQLLQSSFNEQIKEKIDRFGIRPDQLEIEITESILLDNLEMVNLKFKEIRSLGVHIALDDFGTGYSSFVRLHELLIDTLKIDRGFINKLENSSRDLIIGDIIKMTHRFGVKVVAEGIEHEMQRTFLLTQECDYLQGFLFSRSVTRESAFKMLETEVL